MSSYVSEDLGIPVTDTSSTPVAVSPRSPITVGLSGTHNASVQFQWSPDTSGSAWYSLGDIFITTATGQRTLEAGRARRVRATVSSYSSGTPVGTILHDSSLSAHLLERTFKSGTLAIASSVAAGAATALDGGEQCVIGLSGTFTATVQMQVSLSAAGSDWHNVGLPLTAAGSVVVARGAAARVRANTTAYTSGTPVATINRGLSTELVANLPVDLETVTSGALSLDVLTSLISVTGTKAYTLADGRYEGQIKKFVVILAATTPDGTLTPANFADGTSIDLDALLEAGELVWTAAGWRIMNFKGMTIT